MLRKGLAVAVILLFIGVAFAPSINAEIESNESTYTDFLDDGSLSGYVYDTNMKPIKGALVRVYFHETYEENYTNSYGYYHVTNIPICWCMKNCTASKEDYVTEWVYLSIGENTTYNFVLEQDDSDLVEFDVEFCGLGKKHTVQLTQEEADEVELLFDEIEQRLSEVETREETELIFKDAIVELNKYGLLGELSVRQAQQMAIQNHKQLKIINRILPDGNSNYLCLIAGETTNTFFMGIPVWATILFLYVLGFGMPLGSYLLTCLLSLIKTVGNIINPISIFNFIGIGVMKTRDGLEFFPADGWLWTIGLNGIKSWNGTFAGDFGPIIILWFMMRFYYSGVLGFTGIKLFFNNKHFYLGAALQVDMFYPE